MKFTLVIIFCFIFYGCSSIESVKKLQGQGIIRVYEAPYEQIWHATLKACQFNGINIIDANKQKGFISAETNIRATSWGENIAIWVKNLSQNRTEVEVISKTAGPFLLFHYEWEKPILNTISHQIK